jgi:hypothetical protein
MKLKIIKTLLMAINGPYMDVVLVYGGYDHENDNKSDLLMVRLPSWLKAG